MRYCNVDCLPVRHLTFLLRFYLRFRLFLRWGVKWVGGRRGRKSAVNGPLIAGYRSHENVTCVYVTFTSPVT